MYSFANRSLLPILLIISLILNSCQENESFRAKFLISADPFLVRDADEIRAFILASGLDLPLDAIEHNVQLYKVNYRTTFKGEEITASGLVILPVTNGQVAMISFQHGTITAHSQAPTKLPLNSGELIYYASLSTIGLITVVPDYIGFGASEEIFHPYYIEEYTASAVIDLLQAAKELAQLEQVSFNKKLFLAGYSQGGYATMATHKAIEQNGLPSFNLIASFPAAGGYDVKGVQEYFFDQVTYDDPYYLAYVSMAYKTTYEWAEPLATYFKEPYASSIPSLFDGSKTGSQINSELTTTVAELIAPDLLANISTNPAYNHLNEAFQVNSLLNWVPATTMIMYHGDSDITVPYENSVTTYNHFITNGASGTVQFIPLAGATHGTGVVPYIEDFVAKLIDLM
ncbi:alpha/beta hydrolase [Oscillatoria amoena NRMC-F 0135]|nr:alpha/beta hydrolase [Oscillatoria amoena NRMC-F 0135]